MNQESEKYSDTVEKRNKPDSQDWQKRKEPEPSPQTQPQPKTPQKMSQEAMDEHTPGILDEDTPGVVSS